MWRISLNVCVDGGEWWVIIKKNTLPSHVRGLDTTHQMFQLSVKEFTELERESDSWSDLVMQHLTSMGGTRTHAPMREGSEAGAGGEAGAGDESECGELWGGRRRKRSREEAETVPAGMRHALKPLSKMPGREKMADARVRCALCTEKGSIYCLECTKGRVSGIYALCCPSSGRLCACQHWCDMVKMGAIG